MNQDCIRHGRLYVDTQARSGQTLLYIIDIEYVPTLGPDKGNVKEEFVGVIG